MKAELQRGLAGLGLTTTCIDARKAHKSLSARLNKSDAADAEGLAQLARTGWFTPIHIRSEQADRLRSLVGARERLVRLRKDLEGHIRGVLKTFGIRMIGIGQGRQRQAFRDQLAAAGETNPVLRANLSAFACALSISSSRRPGARLMCKAQSVQASKKAWVETPLVNRDTTARTLRSMFWCGCSGGAGAVRGVARGSALEMFAMLVVTALLGAFLGVAMRY